MTNLLEMKKVCKYFAGVRANYNVDFCVKEGEVHALLGENGAGKSTLMNVLYGLYEPTSGEIHIDGKKQCINCPGHAIELGVGMVHQHFMLVSALTVIENVVLGLKEGSPLYLDLNTAAKRLKDLAHQYNMDIDPFAKVWQLSVGQQQRLEILKAMYRGAKLFILDEPTAVLTPQEVEELFNMIRQLKSEGKTIIFISHKLNEVMTICDSITVLRLGEVAATLSVSETNKVQLAQLMVGKMVELTYDKKPMDYPKMPVILSLENVRCNNSKGLPALNGLCLEVKKGEILGIAGVDGNGQTELVDCITGLTKVLGGSIKIKDKDLTNASPLSVLKNGVAHIPEDRHKRGVVLSMNLVENILLMNYYRSEFAKGEWLKWKHINSYAKNIIEQYNVKTPTEYELMANLSGGNQQKVVLGREIQREPDLLIAMHPARGLDIGATEYVQRKIVEERDRGAAVLLVSTELDEIYALSDRIAVMYEGKIMGIVSPKIEIHKLGLMMAGMRVEELELTEAEKGV
ncbi:MAG: ABC transporter ATP-binding protein [Bacillota bacterium]